MIDLPPEMRLVSTVGKMYDQDKEHLSWPPGRAFPDEPLPPYPAGPILYNVKYPRECTSPKYMCPHCEEEFHFHRINGCVLCPFCHNIVSVGNYNRRRCWNHLLMALFLALLAASILTLYIVQFPQQSFLVVSVCFLLLISIFCGLRALHVRHSLEKAPRIIDY